MAKCISVESLGGVSIVAEDAVYDLARLVLRVQMAGDRARSVGQVVTTRGNVTGLAYTLAVASGLPRESVLRELEARGVPLDLNEIGGSQASWSISLVSHRPGMRHAATHAA